MLIKEADDRATEIVQLESLFQSSQDKTLKSSLTKDLAMLRSGIKGEGSTAYYLEYYFRESKNWMLIHDLRLEHNGRVAQIDHLLIGRLLDIYVIESKNFNSGIKITEEGEFFTFYNKRPVSVPSPIEQNKRHIHFLETYLKECRFLPERLGFRIKPELKSAVLVAPNSHITRPKRSRLDTSMVMKADMFYQRFEDDISSVTAKDFLNVGKIMSSDTIEKFARQLVLRHKPASIDYAARYGIVHDPNDQKNDLPNNVQSTGVVAEEKGRYVRKSPGYFCANCKQGISQKVATFCFNNKKRFGGRAFCFECQKAMPG